ncbi:MAG: hypothetical protein IT303_16130 [Dehalococcoidia bacterium]|nr:hypothetical protein [Dehalococcoidia bacterium]
MRTLLAPITANVTRFGLSLGAEPRGWVDNSGPGTFRAGGWRLSLDVRETIQTEATGVVAFRYTVRDAESGQEVFGYHLHPPNPAFSHLHLGAGSGELRDVLFRAHFPAPGFQLEDLVELLVRDLRAVRGR